METVFGYAWPWSIALFFPLALLVFPTGCSRAGSGGASPVHGAVGSPVFVLGVGADPDPGRRRCTLEPWLVLADYRRSSAAAGSPRRLADLAVLVAASVGPRVRYRRGASSAAASCCGWCSRWSMIVVVVPWGLFTPGRSWSC